MTDIWVLSNEAQVILFGSQADHWISIGIHSAEEEKKSIRFSTAEKLFLIAPTPIFKQYLKFHLCKCAPVQNHWSTYKHCKSFCL